MKNPDNDLQNRSPVWLALSELYLDSELDTKDFDRIAETLRSSPYSQTELDKIMFDEVFPVLSPNLRIVAGEWIGFDVASLQTAILERHKRWFKFPARLMPGRDIILENWQTIREITANRPDTR